jgi:hypothetical protein
LWVANLFIDEKCLIQEAHLLVKLAYSSLHHLLDDIRGLAGVLGLLTQYFGLLH